MASYVNILTRCEVPSCRRLADEHRYCRHHRIHGPEQKQVNDAEALRVEYNTVHVPLFPREHKLIRIFVSSTFEDMVNERNHLTEHIYPKLIAYCEDKGWRFSTVDLRWGIRDESTDDHRTTCICMDEILRSQELSPGANFALLLGDRCGWRPLPPYIPEHEFKLLAPLIKDRKLFEQWYPEDQNAVPEPIYALPSLNESNRSSFWKEVSPTLIPQLHKAAKTLREQGKLTFDRYARYYSSVTENEVVDGILNTDHDQKPVVFLRSIQNLDVSAKNGTKFANTIKEGDKVVLDKESYDLVGNLKTRLPKVVPKDRLYEYKSTWEGEGISTDHIEQFGQDFEAAMKKLIDDEMKRFEEPSDVIEEQKTHEFMMQSKADKAMRRPQVSDKVEKLCGGVNKTPVILTGVAGSGRATLASMFAETEVKRTKDMNGIVVTRFFGMTEGSADVGGTLAAVFSELMVALFGPDAMEVGKNPDYGKLANEGPFTGFSRLLADMQKEDKGLKDRPVFFVFCNVPLTWFQDVDGAEGLRKLCTDLRKFVLGRDNSGIIMTMNQIEDSSVREAAKENGWEFIEVPQLTDEESPRMFDTIMAARNRALSPNQRKWVVDGFKTSQKLPLHLHLLSSYVAEWRSFDNETYRMPLPATVQTTLAALFDRLERYHGKVLVGRVMSYIAIAGVIAEDRLVTGLSYDPVLIDDISQYHSATQLPPVVWSRLISDLSQFVRVVNGTLRPSFNSVTRAVEMRYMSGENSRAYYAAGLAEFMCTTVRASTWVYDFDLAKEEKGNLSDDTISFVMKIRERRPKRTWENTDDYKGCEYQDLLLLADIFIISKQFKRCDELLADYKAMHILINVSRKVLHIGNSLIRRVIMARDAGGDLPNLTLTLQALDPNLNILGGGSFYLPFEALPENCKRMATIMNLRHRGTDFLHYDKGNWMIMNRPFPHAHVKGSKTIWSRKGHGHTKIMRVQKTDKLSPNDKKMIDMAVGRMIGRINPQTVDYPLPLPYAMAKKTFGFANVGHRLRQQKEAFARERKAREDAREQEVAMESAIVDAAAAHYEKAMKEPVPKPAKRAKKESVQSKATSQSVKTQSASPGVVDTEDVGPKSCMSCSIM